MLIEKTKLRPELKNLPARMADLPVDERGYPVPWFVEWIDGKPEFRIMDGRKWKRAVIDHRCWVCGNRLGSNVCFVLGPMCGISRTTSEPPCHRECAQWSARSCPFLTRPHMTRRGEEELTEMGAQSIGGIAIKRNPGVTLLWVTRDFEVWRPEPGLILIQVGDPEEVEWYAEGRPATRAEVEESIRTGLPLLEAEAEKQEGAMEDLQRRVAEFERFLPVK